MGRMWDEAVGGWGEEEREMQSQANARDINEGQTSFTSQ